MLQNEVEIRVYDFQSIGHESNRIGNDECKDVACSRVTIVTVMNVK
jgi:hypothetical protein